MSSPPLLAPVVGGSPGLLLSRDPPPRAWSPRDKCSYLGLSHGNLRVHYKGHGKTSRDAASVRATHPIPAACGIYYFEVKIISKGRDGYMGIGLSTQGVNLNRLPGIAFTDLPPNLYPTVGLQTPGEVVDANFGQSPFVFDIEDYIREWRTKIQAQIERFPVAGDWQSIIQRMVSSYLVHHGYCSTAEAFAKSTDQTVQEELASIKNRQRIQKLVLAGRMGEAIETTQQLYPNLLERNPNLFFTLKVRQFIEMVNGTDSEVRCLGGRSPKSQDSYSGSDSNCSNGVISNKSHQSHSRSKHQPSSLNVTELNSINMTMSQQISNYTSNDVEMETDHYSNGFAAASSNGFLNGSTKHDNELEECDTEMEVDSTQVRRQLCGGSQAAVERMICFGRELQAMSEQLRRERGKNATNKNMLKDAFSLLAYSDPWNSPVGYQLDPIQREHVCSSLNSAILDIHNLPKQPPLSLALEQAAQCLEMMAHSGIGSCAFARLSDYLH
ncbi:ran-binding protein 9 isoform X2 [Engystomops pustulosus]|uniref:ran-binding protein 9 isoform X2 n=1 Tax=Engystomops pustulosus TaxID=76066 RepID=UPI003AFA8D10